MDYRLLSNAELLQRLRELAAHERRAAADFLACLAEADRREAIIGAGYPSLFDFCVRDLKLAESTAYQRVKAARLARARPEILSLLAEGVINLSNLCLIAPQLGDHPELLERIVGKSKREVESLVASLGGAARDVPDRIRPLAFHAAGPAEPGLFSPEMRSAKANGASVPSRVASASLSATQAPITVVPAPRLCPELEPLPEPRSEIRFAAGSRFVAAIEKLRALLWHAHPTGHLEDILYTAVAEFIARHDPARLPKRSASGVDRLHDPRVRRIPAAVRRAVWRRDGGSCSFLGPTGRCGAVKGIELDHILPWARGGSSVSSNLRLLCRAHNQHEARRVFGKFWLRSGEQRADKSLPG